MDVWRMIGGGVIGCALGLTIVAAFMVRIEGLEWYVFAYCAFWCALIALLGWEIVRVAS